MAVGTAPRGVAWRVWQWRWRVLVLLIVVGLTTLALALNASRAQPKVIGNAVVGSKPVIAQAGVVPAVEQKLGFKDGGAIKHVAVTIGAKVKAGDVVATLDSRVLELKVEEAAANLDIQKATIIQSSEVAPSDVTAAKVALESALAHQAQVAGGAAVGDVKAAQETVAAARAGVASARAQADKVNASPTASDIAAAESSIRSAEAQVAAANQKLADARNRPRAQDVSAAQLGVEQAKNSLWAQQLSRDSTCGSHGASSGICQSADASVAAQDTAVRTAQTNLEIAKLPATPQELAADQSAVQSATAALASANQQLAKVRAGSTSADRGGAVAQIDQATSNVRSAQAKLDQLQTGSTSADRESARSAVEQARATLAKLTSDPTTATVELSKAKVHQADVALAEAKLAVQNTTLLAPFDGVVTSIALKDGDVAAAGVPVLTVADLSSLRFETKDLDEVSAARVHVGQEVLVTIPALDKKSFAGTVAELASEPTTTQSGDVNYIAKIVLNDPPAELRWGQTARIEFK